MAEQHGFQRTECACDMCQIPCRHNPGGLDVADLERMCPAGQDIFVWAEEHLRALTEKPWPVLVPSRHVKGHCHWYYEGKCLVHDIAPYGCAFFDSHMPADQVAGRYAAMSAARQADAAAHGLYEHVWLHLCRKGLIGRPGKTADLAAALHRLRETGG
jgi:hypothetical protein